MPELPEVEITRRHLEQWILGGTITLARAADTRITRDSPLTFGRGLVGAKVVRVERRGKWVKVTLSSGRAVFSHLGMTGKWRSAGPDDAPLRSEHARLDLTRGRVHLSVRYTDARRFGRLLVASATTDIPEWRELGRDPHADGLDARSLGVALAGRKAAIKAVLLDQTVLAGVGNIIATDALFRARIDPRAPAASLDAAALRRLSRALHQTIDAGLAEHTRSSLRYLHELDTGNPFLVYGREDEPCPRCKTPIAKATIGGRTTAYCPRCQSSRGSTAHKKKLPPEASHGLRRESRVCPVRTV